MRARGRILALAIAGVAASSALLLSAAGASSAGSGSPARIVIPGLTSDSAPALQQCDPTNLTAPVFVFENVREEQVAGFDGQMFDGLLINRCSEAVSGLAASAATSDASGNYVGMSFFHPYFGLIPPGSASPFFVVVPPGRATVTGLGFAVLRYSLVAASTPQLQVSAGAATVGASGATIDYTVTNSGSAAAVVPRIAGRLDGAGCDQPYVIQYLEDAAPLLPGGKTTGSLLVPDTCGGIPELHVGADMPAPASLPVGLSIPAASVTYSGTTLQVVANVCNNSTANVDQPALTAQFHGPSGSFTASLSPTGFYPAQACAPLVATVPNAPPGLTFDHLVPSSSQVTAASGSPIVSPPLDPEEDEFRDSPIGWWLKAFGRVDINFGQTPPLPANPPANFSTADGASVGSPSSQTAAGTNLILISIIYNQNPDPIASSDYSILVVGNDANGVPVAGIAVTSPPGLPAFGWGIATTDLTAANVVAPPGVTFFIQPEGFVP